MIHRNPVELGVVVPLHLGEQVTDEWLQVGEPGAVLGRDDESEQVRISLRSVKEGRPIGFIVRGVIEMAGGALADNAVAQDVFDMGAAQRSPPIILV